MSKQTSRGHFVCEKDNFKKTLHYKPCRFPLEMADNPRDSTLVGGGPGLRIPREMADSYTAL